MVIKILGGGCKNCQNLYKNTMEALEIVGIEAEVLKVEDINEIMSYGVMKTPALVVDEEVKIMGRVAKSKELAKLFKS
ncbi:thioredoxin family protein [Vallitalea guaymasensis]|uniref:TM0996/MTH895 family glutaredoxin-like protein n=1 Tax=Vallitalea guaymasensis TaxID=1185412 RepID=A0A8J8SAV6_9FIRM|nr:thioredoxin family protein [Vallitalea guaymasensis]QUH27760.1 TM0996/MTH895 family glutaredoxin-like protein [Vallitalea guaymasensis]